MAGEIRTGVGATGVHDYIKTEFLSQEVEAVWNCSMAIIKAGVIPPSCYQVSEAIVAVLADYGIEAECVCLDVYAWNKDADTLGVDSNTRNQKRYNDWKKFNTQDRPPKGWKKRQYWNELRNLDPYTLGVFHGQTVDGDGYDGHVAVIVHDPKFGEDKPLLIDATWGQFDRSAKGVPCAEGQIIPLHAFFPLPENWGRYGHSIVDDTTLDYPDVKFAHREFPEGHSVLVALLPDHPQVWMDRSPQTPANIQSTIERLRHETTQVLEHLRE